MKSKDLKRKEEAARLEARAKRGDEGQLKRLDKMFGKGQGAKRERARLTEILAR